MFQINCLSIVYHNFKSIFRLDFFWLKMKENKLIEQGHLSSTDDLMKFYKSFDQMIDEYFEYIIKVIH